MTPVRAAELLPTSWNADLARSAGITAGEWLDVGTGIAIGVLLMLGAILIAWWQRVIQVRDRAVERAAQAELRREEQERQNHLDRRDEWRAEYDETRGLLKRCVAAVDKVLDNGPYTSAGFAALGLDALRMEAEQQARLGFDGLRSQLRLVSEKIDNLVRAAVPEESDVMSAHAASDVTLIVPTLQLRAVQQQAVRQYRAAAELSDEINKAWRTLRIEWGGS
jgi:hypothetical protein